MSIVARDDAEHYTWGDGCDGWHLVRGRQLSVILERMPPGTSEQPHVHDRARQFFFVFSGVATMQLGAETLRAEPGQGIEVAPGVAHRMRNDGARDLEFLVVSQPPSHGDRRVPDRER